MFGPDILEKRHAFAIFQFALLQVGEGEIHVKSAYWDIENYAFE